MKTIIREAPTFTLSDRCPACGARCDTIITDNTGEPLGCNHCLSRASTLVTPVPEVCPRCGEPLAGYDVSVWLDKDGAVVACEDCAGREDIYSYAVDRAVRCPAPEGPWGEDLGPCTYDEGVAI